MSLTPSKPWSLHGCGRRPLYGHGSPRSGSRPTPEVVILDLRAARAALSPRASHVLRTIPGSLDASSPQGSSSPAEKEILEKQWQWMLTLLHPLHTCTTHNTQTHMLAVRLPPHTVGTPTTPVNSPPPKGTNRSVQKTNSNT